MIDKKIKIFLKNINKEFEVNYGLKVYELLKYLENQEEYIAAFVNNEATSLSYNLKINSKVEFITITNTFGMEIYRRSLSFLLTKVVKKLFPNRRLIIGHSLGPGYYFDLINEKELTKEETAKIKEEMLKEIEADKPIIREKIGYEEALEYFRKNNREDKVKLLESLNMSKLSIYKCDDFFEVFDGPLALRTGILKVFDIIYYAPGFILQFPKKSEPDKVSPFTEQRKIFEVYRESKYRGKILKVDNVGALNEIIRNNEIDNFIQIAEELQTREIIKISDTIASQKDRIKLITIAGPSSSGKTTFSKKLSLMLETNGIKPFTLSIDNYFVDREKTPKDENGKPDYESIYALNIELLNENLVKLMKGEKVRLPRYDFFTGKSTLSNEETSLKRNQMIIIEGIHCLNDELTPFIPREEKFKIYVSALTQMNIDDNNRIPTTDNRILRRMVRDYKYRGHSAKKTFQMWPLVRNGEEKYIFPFQNEADGYFNSSLDYELAVLKPYAEPILMQIKPYDEEYADAIRLLKFLNYFLSVPSKNVPSTSILREFIGGSFFDY